jgi:hypothetical protein
MTIKCAKCGYPFDPSIQASWCRGRGCAMNHYPTVRVDVPDFRPAEIEPPKPQRKSLQSDFRLLWNDDL